jgi:hypothetical protein
MFAGMCLSWATSGERSNPDQLKFTKGIVRAHFDHGRLAQVASALQKIEEQIGGA